MNLGRPGRIQGMPILQIGDPGEGSVAEIFERIDRARLAANARVEPWQAELKLGDHFVRLVLTEPGTVVAVYGEILQTYEEPRLEHYRFTRCFSVVLPEGELGDTHVSVIHKKLSPSQFNLAQEWASPPTAVSGRSSPFNRPSRCK